MKPIQSLPALPIIGILSCTMNYSTMAMSVAVAGFACQFVCAGIDPAKVAAPAGGAALPITSITLYRSGVGYFERHGSISSGDSVQLRFASDEINDMLKSMVIFDPDQALQSVTYESEEPLARQLASFSIDLSDNPDLATMLGRLRGTRARFVTSDGPLAGVILGGEMRDQALGQAQEAVSVPFVNLVTDSGIRAINLTTTVSVELEDPALNAELMKALAALASHSTDRFKTVDLAFGGTGKREVVVSYVKEMPIWKTSYRLVLADEEQPSVKPTIQGWAIVENTTDDDWQGVQLALVASQPVSFQMNLAESLHISRPHVPVPMVGGAAPRVYQDSDAYFADKQLDNISDAAASRSAPAPAAGSGGGGEPMQRDRSLGRKQESDPRLSSPLSLDDAAGVDWPYEAQAKAQASAVGETFQYQLSNPISISRQQSAMLPILTSPIDGRRVSIFNRADGIDHPMRGVEITNSTGLQFIPGPIAVFDGYSYAGDAEIGYLTLNDKRLLAYAVDLDVSVAANNEGQTMVRSLRIIDGVVEQTFKHVNTVFYAFNNKDAERGRTLVVECAKLPDWTLTAPAKADSETEGLYRFDVPLAAGAKAKLVVSQEHIDRQRIGVVGYHMPTLLEYAADGRASAAVVDAVRKAAQLQAAADDTSTRIARLGQERQGIETDQNRIRQNMAAVDHDTDIYRRYIAKFSEQESMLEAIRETDTKEHETLAKQQAVLTTFLRSLNVE